MSTEPACTDPAGLAGAVAAYCREHDLLPTAGTVVVAFSGGPDSAGLLHVLAHLMPGRVHAVHVDHGLTPASSDLATAAAALAGCCGVPCERRRVDVDEALIRDRGLEAAARVVRYAALSDAMASLGAEVCALGHTADDRAETVLMNLMRGTGLDGLTAMRARRGPFVRPLLGTRRTDVAAYCDAVGLDPLSDPANADPAILRNRVRSELVVVLERLRPGAMGRIAAAAARLEADADLLAGIASEAVDTCTTTGAGYVAFDLDALDELPSAVAARVVRAGIAPLLDGVVPPADATAAVRAGSGGQLPGTRLSSRREGSELVVSRDVVGMVPVALPSRGVTDVFGRRVAVNACPAGVALSARPVAAGDRVAGARRTLRDTLAREGVSRLARDDALVVLADGEVAGVAVQGRAWMGRDGFDVELQDTGAVLGRGDADGTGHARDRGPDGR